jgi:putative transposase
MIEGDHPKISVRRPWTLLGLPRASLYYQPRGESAETLHLMRLLDPQYTATPFYGIRRMTAWRRTPGYQVNHQRVARLMQQMGIAAIYTKPHLSQATVGHVIYPYVLRGVKVARIKHVWSTDITYIRLPQGFVYRVAVLDWCSRYVLSWALSVTLDGPLCREALTQALRHGSRPEIFNTDQGVQFTSSDFTSLRKHEGIQISRDGRGRALDNVFVARLWRTVKYEEVYLKDYTTVREARQGLGQYFTFYNHER